MEPVMEKMVKFVQEAEFKDLPEDWVCPTCGAPKSSFEPMKS